MIVCTVTGVKQRCLHAAKLAERVDMDTHSRIDLYLQQKTWPVARTQSTTNVGAISGPPIPQQDMSGRSKLFSFAGHGSHSGGDPNSLLHQYMNVGALIIRIGFGGFPS